MSSTLGIIVRFGLAQSLLCPWFYMFADIFARYRFVVICCLSFVANCLLAMYFAQLWTIPLPKLAFSRLDNVVSAVKFDCPVAVHIGLTHQHLFFYGDLSRRPHWP